MWLNIDIVSVNLIYYQLVVNKLPHSPEKVTQNVNDTLRFMKYMYPGEIHALYLFRYLLYIWNLLWCKLFSEISRKLMHVEFFDKNCSAMFTVFVCGWSLFLSRAGGCKLNALGKCADQ